jgi:hypothetical protein
MFYTGRFLNTLRHAALLREFIIGWLFVGMLMPSQAAEPTWWNERGIIHPTRPADDYAVLNQGQLKNLFKAAVAEMNANLIGGAGSGLNDIVSSWTASAGEADDYAVVNLGQLKALALPLYQRLLSSGAISHMPSWTSVNDQNDDYAVANIGQAKNLFSFAVPVQEITLPTESPFVIKYWNWRSGQIRPSRGEPEAAPEMVTIYTGTKHTYRWIDGATPSHVPTKQLVQRETVEFDNSQTAGTWQVNNHRQNIFYLHHTNKISLDLDVDSGYGYIFHNQDTRQVTASRSTFIMSTLVNSHFNQIPNLENSSWHTLHNTNEYEVVSADTWTEATVSPTTIAAHWFSQVAEGPASQPAVGWEPAQEIPTANAIGQLEQPGESIPYQNFILPSAGGVVATAHAALSSAQQTYQNAQGQNVTSTRNTGERSLGGVVIAWRSDIATPLTDLQKQEWLTRYRVVQKTSSTIPGRTALSTLPLSNYLNHTSSESHIVILTPTILDGHEEEIEFSLEYLDDPMTRPLVLQAVNTQQSVELGNSTPLPLRAYASSFYKVSGKWLRCVDKRGNALQFRSRLANSPSQHRPAHSLSDY